MSVQLPACLQHCLQCQRKLSVKRWKNNLNNIRTHAHFLIKLSTGMFWELGMGWHPYGSCVSLPCHTLSGSRNRDLKRASRNTNINNIRKANWKCLDKWATSSDFFLPISLNPNFWIRFLCKPGSWWWNLSVWGCGNLKPQLRLPSASEVCSSSPYYIISLKSFNDLLVCLFLTLSFSFISSSCISPLFVLSCICLFMKFLKSDILSINEGVYSHSSYDNR